MARKLRFEKTDNNDYLVTGNNKKPLAVIHSRNGSWAAMLPDDNGSFSEYGVLMATVAVGDWNLAVSTVMSHLLLKQHGGWA